MECAVSDDIAHGVQLRAVKRTPRLGGVAYNQNHIFKAFFKSLLLLFTASW